MKITFIYGGFESLGVEYLSACLKQENFITDLVYSPKLFNDTMSEIPFLAKLFEHKKNTINQIINTKCDIAVFSCVTDDYLWCKEIAKKIKKINKNIITIFGGIHITSVPELVIKENCIDYICIGEGEEALVELCKALKNKTNVTNIKNIWGKDNKKIFKNPVRPLIQDLDSIPFPDKQLFYEKAPYNEEHYTIMASRGCVLNCPFCHHNVSNKVYKDSGYNYRLRSVNNVISELRLARKLYKFKYILFEDDLFLKDKDWIISFCKEYIKSKINKPFFCVAHVNGIDEDIAKWLSKAGCSYIEIGIQTLNKKVRKNNLNRPEEETQVDKALRLLKKYNIAFNLDHIAGIPGDTEENFIFAAKYYNKIRPNRIYLLFMTYYPNTDIADFALKNGYTTKKEVNKKRVGLGGTTTTTGSVTEKWFEPYRFLFGYLPLLPPKLVKFIIKKNIHKKIPKIIFIASVIPETLSAIFFTKNDFRGPVIIKKYFHHLIRGGY